MSQHKGNCLVVGVTRSGKGMFLRGVIEQYRKRGIPVLFYSDKAIEVADVMDMVDYATMDPIEYFKTLKKVSLSGKHKSIISMIDEAGAFYKAARGEMTEILNQFAAYGVEVYVVVQRAKMAVPDIRNACENLVAFRQKPNDAEYLAEQYGSEFLKVSQIPKGDFIGRMGEFGEVVRGQSYRNNGTFERV